MIEAFPLLTALTIGLAAGLNAGPLSIVVIQQTLQHGLWEGLRVCTAPLITDIPIVILSVIVLSYFSGNNVFLVFISLLGGAYLLYLGSKTLLSTGLTGLGRRAPPLRFSQIIRVNVFNPNPYLFWTTVGGTYIVSATLGSAAMFVAVMLVTLVGSKMAIACLTNVFRERMQSPVYLWVNRGLGLALVCYGGIFLVRAYQVAAA